MSRARESERSEECPCQTPIHVCYRSSVRGPAANRANTVSAKRHRRWPERTDARSDSDVAAIAPSGITLMFILFGTKSKAKLVPDGRRGERRCGECNKRTTWVECVVKDSFNIFFVDVLDSTARCMRCTECGEDCAIEDWDRAQRRAQLDASQPSVTAASPRPQDSTPTPAALDVDKEFAALKQRLAQSKK